MPSFLSQRESWLILYDVLGFGRTRVLIVDHSETVYDGLINLISDIEGIEFIGQVTRASNAIDSILRLKPDVMLLDIHLKDGNGIDVLRALRERNLFLPTIVLTNCTYPQYQKKCMELGACYFFDKLQDIDKLPPLLKEWVRKSKYSGVFPRDWPFLDLLPGSEPS
jgi:DNA-binding NarL/FixJ family response regulator